jgi:acetyl-CoA carboxylase biotin carboxyl carrier protein
MGFDLEKVQALLRIVNESGVAEVEVEEDGNRIVIRRTAPTVSVQPSAMPFPMMMPMPGMMPHLPQGAPQQQAQQHDAGQAFPMAQAQPSAPAGPAQPAAQAEPGSGANEILIRAPIVGTFYRSPSPDADAFVKEGDRVGPEDTLCIIEAMKLMNEIQAETSGTIKQILVENAQPVEYDQPLFVLEA